MWICHDIQAYGHLKSNLISYCIFKEYYSAVDWGWEWRTSLTFSQIAWETLFWIFHYFQPAFLNLRLAQQLAEMDPSRVASMAHDGTVASFWFLLPTGFCDI